MTAVIYELCRDDNDRAMWQRCQTLPVGGDPTVILTNWFEDEDELPTGTYRCEVPGRGARILHWPGRVAA